MVNGGEQMKGSGVLMAKRRRISMKTLLMPAAAVALMLAAPAALAADDHHQDKGGHAATHAAAPHAQVSTRVHTTGTSHATVHMDRTTAGPRISHDDTSTGHRGSTHVTTTASPATVAHGSQIRGNNMGSSTARVSAGHSNQVVQNFNRRNISARHHYHYRGGDYRGPNGYSYRRWTYGEDLPSIYFVQDYWITDYSDYGLQDPPYGCTWVRYGDDALLIDEDTGEILEVVYGQFY
jgi:Ni/Co efflux regulator RcnB